MVYQKPDKGRIRTETRIRTEANPQAEGHLKFSGTKKEIDMIFVVQFRKAHGNTNGLEE